MVDVRSHLTQAETLLHSCLLILATHPEFLAVTHAHPLSSIMEYHAVPPEERARDEKGNLLPWGYIYKECVNKVIAPTVYSWDTRTNTVPASLAIPDDRRRRQGPLAKDGALDTNTVDLEHAPALQRGERTPV